MASSAVPRAAVGTAIDDYIAHGAVNLRNVRAVLVSQHGELLAERYYHSDAAAYAEIHSATKSVISTLVGIALTKGDLESLDQTLGELLPQHRSVMSKSSARTSVRQLLTMTGGWTAFYDADTAKLSLVRRLLMAGPEGDPGGFIYSNVGPHLLSAVLAQASGTSTLAYARRELFGPLGINSQPAFQGPMAQRDNPDVVSTNSFRWLRDPDGLHAGPYGLTPIRSPSSKAKDPRLRISLVDHTAGDAPRLQRTGQVRAADHRRAGSAGRHRDLLTRIG